MTTTTPSNLESYYATHENDGLAKPLLANEAPANDNATTPEAAELGHALDPRHSQGGKAAAGRCSTLQTTAALLTLQLGWGLWLLPCDFARLGWIPGFATLIILALSTAYSGTLFTRLYSAVPNAVLFGDIGASAAGRKGRALVYLTIYSLDATRCIILHLAATQSLFHAVAPLLGPQGALPLWQCSVLVGVVVLLLGQIRYLTQLSSFFMAGTVAQMVALAIVIYDLMINAGRSTGGASQSALPSGGDDVGGSLASSLLLRSPLIADKLFSGNWAPAAMAVLNMIFAYGGQFAFLELITSMKTPARFSAAVTLCTAIMTALYGGFGAVGYWSKGSNVHGIVIFNMSPGLPAQIAAAFIFFQALAQYLVNLNVWTHNLLVLVSRRANNAGSDSWAEDNHAKSTGDHASSHWLAATAFVAAYSAVIAVAVPFFCTLVGLVTSVTYLTCAYTLPAWFAIKLLGSKLGGLEKAWLVFLIPVSIALSVVGFVASVRTYITEASGGEGM
ncbi:hypothetical protein PLESTB_000171200 [Pleodorina starrii]|uniref:Amino acid transporter transmembrane domain-containing protein n=1 Tax=Pleodorina starrii TaxID=330485 RepID=A0A9W6BCG0_9CHLO|nr:hypothetical protein PLESTM_000525700 [Pleodorina starrii]GLC48996.1 hypothetical protein PLESTB_000171200 [Pleodorina starrii]GLC66209.1 hypothetical protein PLESTF_000396700 [Pleodorina starrii]